MENVLYYALMDNKGIIETFNTPEELNYKDIEHLEHEGDLLYVAVLGVYN